MVRLLFAECHIEPGTRALRNIGEAAHGIKTVAAEVNEATDLLVGLLGRHGTLSKVMQHLEHLPIFLPPSNNKKEETREEKEREL